MRERRCPAGQKKDATRRGRVVLQNCRSHGKKPPNQKKGKKKNSSFFWDQEESFSAMVSMTVSTQGPVI